MPAPLHPHPQASLVGLDAPREHGSRVHASVEEDTIADIHQTLTNPHYKDPHSSLDQFLEKQGQEGRKRSNLGVCFQSVTTWGAGDRHAPVKTLGVALWRTLTLQDVYEWTIRSWLSAKRPQEGYPRVRDFSGIVQSGEMMLYVCPQHPTLVRPSSDLLPRVLGRPGAGCSTFLRTIAGLHNFFSRG